jgi:Glycosyl transferase family 2
MTSPRVGLGLFVYNGERHLVEAMDSLLSQTMGDFVLDVSDNGSTDLTEEICRSYAAMDSRVHYVRHDVNRGPVWNTNFAMRRSPMTEFYKGCAHDDVYAPTYLERCVELLDEDPEIVACHSRTRYINENAEEIMRSFRTEGFTDPLPWVRFEQVLLRIHDYSNIFALMRRSALARIHPFQMVFAGDGVVLAEMVFQGPFGLVPEHLFANRMHPGRATAVATRGREPQIWADWIGASNPMPLWQTQMAYRRGIATSPLDEVAKARCYAVLSRWMARRWKGFSWELATGGPQLVRERLSKGEGTPRR